MTGSWTLRFHHITPAGRRGEEGAADSRALPSHVFRLYTPDQVQRQYQQQSARPPLQLVMGTVPAQRLFHAVISCTPAAHRRFWGGRGFHPCGLQKQGQARRFVGGTRQVSTPANHDRGPRATEAPRAGTTRVTHDHPSPRSDLHPRRCRHLPCTCRQRRKSAWGFLAGYRAP